MTQRNTSMNLFNLKPDDKYFDCKLSVLIVAVVFVIPAACIHYLQPPKRQPTLPPATAADVAEQLVAWSNLFAVTPISAKYADSVMRTEKGVWIMRMGTNYYVSGDGIKWQEIPQNRPTEAKP